MSASASFQHFETSKRELLRLFRMLAGFLLGVALSAWVCFANAAATGYIFNGRCHATQSEVLTAFIYNFNTVVLGTDYELCAGAFSPVIVATPAATNLAPGPYTIQYYRRNSTSAANGDYCSGSYPQQFTLAPCDPDVQSLAFTGTNALFLVLGFFYAAMLGFKTGYRA